MSDAAAASKSTSTEARHEPSGRGRATLAVDWWPRDLPSGTTITPETLIAHDGEVSRGVLYRRGSSDTVFCLTHPRVDMQRHPAVVDLLESGAAVWAHAGRNVGNDLTLVHEQALLDVAAGITSLREHAFERIVLVGFSGGAGLYSYYTEQSLLDPGSRVERTPGGRPVKLAEAEMEPPEALALFAPHPGQGRLLLGAIDPSVTDEDDALSVDPDLDPFEPANGFAPGPEGASYDPAFVERYREAQRERVTRLDERAREAIEEQQAARKRAKSDDGTVADRRRSTAMPVLVTHRTDADLRCMDLSLDPNERRYGSVISGRPEVSNYGLGGFGRLTVPEAWLSTWSGLSSRAALARTAAGITVPTLVGEYTGDCSVFPTDVRETVDALAADDVTHVKVHADHFGRRLSEEDEAPMTTTVRSILEWADQRRP